VDGHQRPTPGDTGHVMVVLAAPTRNPDRACEWLMRRADSTLSPHARDSRPKGVTGLGTGTMGLMVDVRDAPTAFHWQGGISTQANPPRSRSIALYDSPTAIAVSTPLRGPLPRSPLHTLDRATPITNRPPQPTGHT